jgi:AcrR family transcriptional regulator
MGQARFSHNEFLDAAQAIAAAAGPAAATIAAIAGRLGAPTGSFYHRFASRDVLLGELWLRTVLDFQRGLKAALDVGNGLQAALHTPAWVRAHPDEARLLLIYDRRDFIQGEGPDELRDRVAEMTRHMEAGAARRSRAVFGATGREEVRLAQFLISEMPVAAVRQHLVRDEPPPPLVDRLIRITYRAVVADYRAQKRQTKEGKQP